MGFLQVQKKHTKCAMKLKKESTKCECTKVQNTQVSSLLGECNLLDLHSQI